MFSYYGSKSKLVKYYPPPKHDKIIEPFAGSARYSLKYFDRDVLLVDKYPVIVEIWKYLQAASKKDILGLPDVGKGDDIRELGLEREVELLIGFCINQGSAQPKKTAQSFNNWNKYKGKLAAQLFKIRHWEIRLGDYTDIPDQSATWFIDPPYQNGGEHYKMSANDIDFPALAKWCQSRSGQVIVCENTKADWLPFRPMTEFSGAYTKTTEAIWTNYETHYDWSQLDMFAPAVRM